MRNKTIKLIPIVFFLLFASGVQAAAYDFFVDDDSAAVSPDGSEAAPFKTIGAALAHIAEGNLKEKIIFVKNGTYAESISLSRDVKLVGESKSGAIIDADAHQNAINFVSTKSELRTLTIKNAEATNVIVDKKSKVTINNCAIEKAGKYGVEVKASSATEKYKFILEDSTVSESGSQGLYIDKRKISIADNEIAGSDEEGIDLHQGVKGTVSGNSIHGNGESGIESILSGVTLTFKSNHVTSNHTQGITVQVYSKKNGKIKMIRNTVRGNHAHGLRFANYTRSIGPKKFRQFVDKKIKLSKNTIKDNGEEEIFYE